MLVMKSRLYLLPLLLARLKRERRKKDWKRLCPVLKQIWLHNLYLCRAICWGGAGGSSSSARTATPRVHRGVCAPWRVCTMARATAPCVFHTTHHHVCATLCVAQVFDSVAVMVLIPCVDRGLYQRHWGSGT